MRCACRGGLYLYVECQQLITLAIGYLHCIFNTIISILVLEQVNTNRLFNRVHDLYPTVSLNIIIASDSLGAIFLSIQRVVI